MKDNGGPYSIILISNERFATCGRKALNIWKGNEPYSSTPLHVIEDPNIDYFLQILYFPKLDAILSRSSFTDKEFPNLALFKIKKWDMKTFNCLGEFKSNETSYITPFTDDSVLFGQNIFDANKMTVNYNLKIDVYYPKELRLGDDILLSQPSGIIKRYNIKTFC